MNLEISEFNIAQPLTLDAHKQGTIHIINYYK